MTPAGPFFGRASLATLAQDLEFLDRQGLLPEVYLSADALDGLSPSAVEPLLRHRERGKDLSFHAPFVDLSPAGLDPRVREVTRQRFHQVRGLCESLRPRTVVFHPGYDHWRFGGRDELWLEGSRAVWEEVLGWGQACGARVALENVFETRPDTLVELRRRLGPGLGFCFDTGHFALFAKVPIGEWLSALGDGLVELHLHDNLGDRDAHLPVGEGAFDFPSLFAHLEAASLKPLVVLEHHTREHTLRSAANLERWRSGGGLAPRPRP